MPKFVHPTPEQLELLEREAIQMRNQAIRDSFKSFISFLRAPFAGKVISGKRAA